MLIKTLINLYLLTAVILLSYITTYVLSKSKVNYIKYFSALSVCLSIYVFGYLLEFNSSTLDQMIFWNQIQYIGVPFYSALWFSVALIYTDKIKSLVGLKLLLLFAIPIITFVVRITNSIHYIFYSYYELRTTAGFPVMHFGKGPWYYVQMVYHILLLTLTAGVFIMEYIKGNKDDKRKYGLLAIASLAPYLSFIFILLDYKQISIDYGALIIPITASIVVYTIIYYDFLGVKTLARDTMFNNNSDGMLIIDNNNKIIDFNEQARHFFNSLNIDLQQKNLENIVIDTKILMQLNSTEDEEIITDNAGAKVYYDITTSVMYDGRNRKLGVLKTIRDITDKMKILKQLEEQATVDELSGLINRRQFINLAEKEFLRAKRYKNVFTLLMIDIDHFKKINDEKGHDAGDQVIKEIGRQLNEGFRKTDISARLGGEEFTVILINTNLEEGMALAEQFRERISNVMVSYEGEDIQFTVSIGITVFDSKAENFNHLLKLSDQAMYQAKQKGRNCTSVKLLS